MKTAAALIALSLLLAACDQISTAGRYQVIFERGAVIRVDTHTGEVAYTGLLNKGCTGEQLCVVMPPAR
jgi:hypothetical protein